MQGSKQFERRCGALYGLTLLLEAPTMLARYVAGLVAASGLMWMGGHDGGSATEWAKLAAVGPLAWSAMALLTPQGSGWWWRRQLGAREPSEREQRAYEQAREALRSRMRTSLPVPEHSPLPTPQDTPLPVPEHTPLPTPERWFVLDDARCAAATYGKTLILSRGALGLQDGQLAALLAHELAHLRGLDGKLVVAVNRLVLNPLKPKEPRSADLRPRERAQPPDQRLPTPRPMIANHRVQNTMATASLTRWTLSKVWTLIRGGLGLRLTSGAWGAVWREQDYEADRWVAGIGWAQELADFLETHVLELDHPIPLVNLTDHAHPPTELRIERLRRSAHTQPPSTPGTGPIWIGGEPA